jgi:hypothetical protein
MIDNIKKILKMLEALGDDVTAIKTEVAILRGGQKALESGQQALDHKVEAIHAYQKQTHTEIMEHLIDSNEVASKAQRTLEEQVEQIKKHVGLPPLK